MNKIDDKKDEVVKKEIDHSHCASCNKKLGIRGFKCQCENSYCKNHRMPEDHECDFDFQEKERKRLAQQNDQVKKTKIPDF